MLFIVLFESTAGVSKLCFSQRLLAVLIGRVSVHTHIHALTEPALSFVMQTLKALELYR